MDLEAKGKVEEVEDILKQTVNGLMGRWLTGFENLLHRKGDPAFAKTVYAKRHKVEKFGVVNKAHRFSFRVVEVTKYYERNEKGEPVGEEKTVTRDAGKQCLEDLAPVLRCGSTTKRLFAGAMIRNNKFVATLFSRNNRAQKNISISGPSHVGVTIDCATTFFHMLRSLQPPPVPVSSSRHDPHKPYRSVIRYYDAIDIRQWQTNQVITANFGNVRLSIEGIRASPIVGDSSYEPENFPGCTFYPSPRGFSDEEEEEDTEEDTEDDFDINEEEGGETGMMVVANGHPPPPPLSSSKILKVCSAESYSSACAFDTGQVILLHTQPSLFCTLNVLMEMLYKQTGTVSSHTPKDRQNARVVHNNSFNRQNHFVITDGESVKK